MLIPNFSKPPRDIITTGQENIAIIGETGCGKSNALVPLINKYLENCSVFLITSGIPQKLNHDNLTKILRTPFSRKYTNDPDFHELDHDVIIIDEMHMLYGDEENKLLMMMEEKQDIKFIITSQNFHKRFEKVIDKFFIGHCSKTVLHDFFNDASVSEASQCENPKHFEWIIYKKLENNQNLVR